MYNMWKYVSRRIRDTFERSVNHFEKRSSAGVVNSANNNNVGEDKNSSSSTPPAPCRWFCARKCWTSGQEGGNTNNNQWNFEQINHSWISAITWSSAVVIGWYSSQLIHLKFKYRANRCCPAFNGIFSDLSPYISLVNKSPESLNPITSIEKNIKSFIPTVYQLTNDTKSGNAKSGTSQSSTNSGTSDDELRDVLNSIENKLGLAAIENGKHQDGLNLLRSAATRNHAPALYNLGLCYELGLGVTANEKMAMELYRSAAALEHPGALYNLGIYYGQGRGGLPRDIHTATRLLRLAAVQGQQDAIEALKVLHDDPAEASFSQSEDPWLYPYKPNTHNECIVPTHTTLFVENVNYLQKRTSVY